MPAKYPLLIIDDEADQASINNNVGKGKEAEETEPTSINRLIRQILDLFYRMIMQFVFFNNYRLYCVFQAAILSVLLHFLTV